MSRRLMLRNASGGGILPPEYQQVEWIGSTGTQFILLDRYPSKTSSFTVRFRFSNTPTAYQRIYGYIESANLVCITVFYSTILNSSYSYGDSDAVYSDSALQPTNWCEIHCEPGLQTINGVVKSQRTVTRGLHKPNMRMAIFTRYEEWANGYGAPAKDLQIAYAEVDGASIIPCYRKSDGVIGMYDTVSKTFYTNAGTGTFTKGADV